MPDRPRIVSATPSKVDDQHQPAWTFDRYSRPVRPHCRNNYLGAKPDDVDDNIQLNNLLHIVDKLRGDGGTVIRNPKYICMSTGERSTH